MKSNEHETKSPPLWRNHNYLLLQSGQLVSYIGNQQQFIALPLLALALTGSAVQAGIAVSLNTIAVLVVSPLGGVLNITQRHRHYFYRGGFGCSTCKGRVYKWGHNRIGPLPRFMRTGDSYPMLLGRRHRLAPTSVGVRFIVP
jgi:hypothetical protein